MFAFENRGKLCSLKSKKNNSHSFSLHDANSIITFDIQGLEDSIIHNDGFYKALYSLHLTSSKVD